MLVHYRKDFRTFLYFASTLVGLCPQLERLQAFGTDGETALIEAMAHEFGFATHLLCAIHLRRNIKQQLHDLNFPVEHRRKVLDEIFGGRRGSVYLEGLIDAKSAEDFDLKLAALKPEWDQRECEQSGCVARFHNWFLAHKAEDFKSSAIHPVRERCGLGIPPDTFTTNASETINSVLKSKVDHKKSDLPKFVDKMRSLVDEQQQELERAICQRGKYRLVSDLMHPSLAPVVFSAITTVGFPYIGATPQQSVTNVYIRMATYSYSAACVRDNGICIQKTVSY